MIVCGGAFLSLLYSWQQGGVAHDVLNKSLIVGRSVSSQINTARLISNVQAQPVQATGDSDMGEDAMLLCTCAPGLCCSGKCSKNKGKVYVGYVFVVPFQFFAGKVYFEKNILPMT